MNDAADQLRSQLRAEMPVFSAVALDVGVECRTACGDWRTEGLRQVLDRGPWRLICGPNGTTMSGPSEVGLWIFRLPLEHAQTAAWYATIMRDGLVSKTGQNPVYCNDALHWFRESLAEALMWLQHHEDQ